MARLEALRLGFALALLTLVLDPADCEDKCRTGCQRSTPHTFKYVEGTTYKYNLEGEIDVALSNAEGQQSTTKLRATVLLTQLPQCNQLLKLQNVQVIGPDAKKYSNLADIEKPIRINFHDGHVEDSICAEPGDSQNSLNVKRAVASLFQVNLKHHHETDVFGVCPTEISTRKEGANLVVQKSRNLNKCSHRESIKQDFISTAFNLNSEMKSSPILSGDYTSEQRIKNGILDYAAVTENYLYIPFSVGKSGAKATVSTKIQFAGTAKDNHQSQVSHPRSIIFESPHVVTVEESNANNILNALKETKNSIDATVGETTAKSFVNLIKILRVSKKDDILAVYGQVQAGAGFKDKAGAKKVFLDALFRAGTGESIEAGIELLKNKQLSPIEQKLVYLSLAFVKHATLPSLHAAATLLDQPHLPREAFLGVGTLSGRYCREHDCKDASEVNELVQKLLATLGDGKAHDRHQENKIIAVLKALGNFEHLTDAAFTKIAAIAQDKKAPTRLRVAALETYVTDACKDKVRDSALNILKDIQQDSEIRIKAYLAATKCPNGKVANALKALLENEPSYQVGGFIVSHLRNLKASANPDKELAKHHLGQISTTKKFPIDARKYSFNSEFSYAIDTLGLASSAESDVIYSQKSFLPRSTNLNLTAELFGHTFNFLEIGTRQENLDKLLEHYFGPLGEFRKSSPEELVSTGKASLGKIFEHFQQRLHKTRGKRDVSKVEIDAIGKQVQIKTNELNTDLDLDLSVKIFGSELLFLSISDQSEQFSADALIDKIFDHLDDGIAKAKHFEKSIQSNVLFLDSEFSYPTSLGFPLRLSVEGSSSVQLKAEGSIDIQALLKRNDAPFKLSLIPSADIVIIGSLTADAQVVESGLKVTTSLYTATGGNLEVVTSNGGAGIDVKFSLPVKNQKLVSVTHNIVFNTRELGKSEVDHPIKFGQNKDFSVCIDQLSPFIGLAFCVDINNPPTTSKHGTTLPFPLAGNAKFSVGIEREDVSQYHYKYNLVEGKDKIAAELLLETIGEKHDKKLGLQVEVSLLPELFVKATLQSPIKSATIEGRYINTNNEKSLSLQLQHDNQHYLGKLGVGITKSGDKDILKPLIQYEGPGLQGQKLPLNVEGAIIVEHIDHTTKFTFDNVRIVTANQKALSIQGHVGHASNGLTSDLTVSDGVHSGSLRGKFQLAGNNFKLNAEVTNTFNPHANVNIKYEFKRSQHLIDSNLQLIHGPDLSSKINKLTLINTFTHKPKGGSDFESTAKNKFSYPLLKLDTKLDYLVSTHRLDYDFDFHYGELKFGSELEFKEGEKSIGDYDVEFKVYGLDNKMEIKLKREVTGFKSKIDNSLEINGKKFEVAGTVKHHYKAEDVNVGADLIIKIPGRSDPFNVQNGLVLNPNELDFHFKIFSGGNTYTDVFLKGTKGGNANGNLKVTLKDFLLANGQLRVANGVGTAYILLDLVRSQRKLKAETSFTISDPTYNVLLTLYPDFERDNNKKLVLSTANQLQANSVDSKNFAELAGKKLEVNFRGSLDGKLNNGKLHAEAEVTLPNNFYVAGKVNREFYIVDDIANGNIAFTLEQRDNKNAPGRKITFTGVLKNSRLNEYLVDVSYNIVAENDHGKNLIADVAVKRLLQGDHIAYSEQLKLHGSVLEQPIEASFSALTKDYVGSFKGETKVGPNEHLAIDGKYDLDEGDKQMNADINIQITSHKVNLRSLKFSASGLIAEPQENQFKFKDALSLDIDVGDPNSNFNIKLESETDYAPNHGQFKGIAHFQKEHPVTVDLGYDVSDAADVQKLNGHLAVHYDADKFVKSEVAIAKPNDHEYKVDFKLDTPKQPGTRLEIFTKKSSDDKIINSEVVLTFDNKKFVLSNELILAELTPGFETKLVLPDGKVDHILAKLNRINPKKIEGELKLAFSETNFVFDSTLDANLESIDDFFIKITANSPALKLHDVVVEAQNKPSKSGKRIQVIAKSEGKNLLSGSTSYKAREEGGKYIIEGSGAFKVKEENKQANFKFIRHTLTAAKDGEDGIELSFNAGLGSKAVDAELKVSNKQFRILNSYCEEKQQCAHVEVDSKTNTATAGEFNHEVEIAVDLRKLGLSHEFGLKGITTRKHFVLDHTVDVYFQSKDNKYQYSLYVHPNEAGAQLTTPKRVIAIEGNVHVPKQKNAPIKGELALYLNKKHQPNQKTALTGFLHCKADKQTANCKAEFKFTNPALGKDLGVTYVSSYDDAKKYFDFKAVADLFVDPSQKIVATGKSYINNVGESVIEALEYLEIHSQGLGIDLTYSENLVAHIDKYDVKYKYQLNSTVGNSRYDSGIVAEFNPRSIVLFVQGFNKELLNSNTHLQIGKDHVVADTEVYACGVTPIVTHLEIRNYDTLKYYASRKGSPDKLQVDASVVPGKAANFQADIIKGGTPHALLHYTVKLDEANFLKTDYTFNAEHLQKLLFAAVKKDIGAFLNEFKALFETISKDVSAQAQKFAELLKKNTIDLKPLRDYYQKELHKLREELVSDKTLKQIGEFLKGIFGVVAGAVQELLIRVSEVTEKVLATLQQQSAKIIELVNKELTPKLSKIGESIVHVSTAVLESLTDLLFAYIGKLNIFIEGHQAELNQISATVTAIGRDLGRLLYKLIQQAQIVVDKEWNEFYEGVKGLPITEELKSKYEQLFTGVAAPDALINTFKEAVITIKDLVPSPDLKKLVAVIGEYIEKKLRNEPVDDAAAIENIIRLAAQVFDKLFKSVSGNELQVSDKSVPLLSLDFLQKLPRLAAVKFSPISYLVEGDLPTLTELLHVLFNPRHLILPYKLQTVVVQGQHIFTFDGKHLTFPGNCDYLLARDAVNGNFSIVGTFTNGLLTAITVADKVDIITLKKGGQVFLNNAATEFPVVRPHGLVAYRQYDALNVHSKAGVHVACGPDLLVCVVHISGFYHAQLRGLLGNGNSEPYDDYTLPNGKIVLSEADFGNAYKLSGSCAAVQTVDHHVHQHHPTCNKLFGEDSPLSPCYLFENPENYKIACSHGLAAGVQDTERAIAVGYVASCRVKLIPINLPAHLAKCESSGQVYTVGDTFAVKTPAKAADIVIIVEQVASNEAIYKELLQPALTQIATELGSKGINDIDFHLVGYGGENQKYPIHYTTSGKLTFRGKSPNLKFTKEPERTPSNNFVEILRAIGHEIKLISGLSIQQKTYSEALKYPFRPHAVKGIIALVGKPCEEGYLPGLQQLRALFYTNKQLSLNLITPFDSFNVRDAKHTKNVVGFNALNVFSLSDGKKKPESGSELHSELDYHDYCADVTIKNRGNVFVTNNFLQAKGPARKQFAQIVAHNVVEQLINVEQGLDCECKLGTPYTAHSVCSVVYTKDRPVGGRKGGHKG